MFDVTLILSKIEAGDLTAAKELLPLVYDELRKLAAVRMRSERKDHTLQATALVHEAYVRLVDVERAQHWNSRGHFFAAAGESMRRILVEHARAKARQKRGGDAIRVNDFEDLPGKGDDASLTLEIHEALEHLAAEDERLATLVKLRCFVGFTLVEAAEALGIARSTAIEDWAYAKSRLRILLSNSPQ
ncbi:ECF-type sigma factor [Pirellulaceae bacterium SH501]